MISKVIKLGRLLPLNNAFLTIRNCPYFKYSTSPNDHNQQKPSEYKPTQIAYYHLYFNQKVKGFEKISPAANQIRQKVQADIKVKVKQFSNKMRSENKSNTQENNKTGTDQNNQSTNKSVSNNQNKQIHMISEGQKISENQLKIIVQASIQLMTEEIATQAKHIFNFMNKRNKIGNSKKLRTSIWEIRKMIEREILWTWSETENLENSKIIEIISQEFCGIYESYVANILQTIVKQGENIHEQYFQIKEKSQNFKSIRECVLENLFQLLKTKSEKTENKEDPVLKKIQTYFYEGFQARFKPTQNVYWQNNLLNEQSRFKQAGKNSQQQKMFGIVYIPTYYTYQVILRVFKEHSSKYNLNITLHEKNSDVRYRYLQGLKFNGKSISVMLARDLFSYLQQKKMITIPNIQIKQLKQFINLLCATVTRDLWRSLSSTEMKEVYSIWKQNNSDQQNLKNKPTAKYQNSIYNMMLKIGAAIGVFISNKNKKISQNVKDLINSNYNSAFLLGKLLKIVQQLEVDIILIDQFNYFGRKIYELFNIKDQKPSVFYQALVYTSIRFYFASLLFKQDQYMCLLASINNYQYLRLIKIFIQLSNDRHSQTKISYLHYGRQMAKKVIEFLSIHVFYQKSTNDIKKQVINKLISEELLFKTLSNVDISFNLKNCQDIAKKIYELLWLKINENQKDTLNEKMIQIVNFAVKFMKEQIQTTVKADLFKLIRQRNFSFLQAGKFLQTLMNIYHKIEQKELTQRQKESKKELPKNFKFFQQINNLPYSDNSRRVSIFVNSKKILHQGYKQIFKDLFQHNNLNQLLIKLFPKYYQSKNWGQMTYQLCQTILKSLLEQEKWDQIPGFKGNMKGFLGIISQNQFGQYFKDKSIRTKPQQSQVQFQFNQISADANNFIDTKFKFSKVVYQSSRLEPEQIFQRLIKKIDQKSKAKIETTEELYVFRTMHTTKKMDFVLFFIKNKTVYIFLTQTGVKKFEEAIKISKENKQQYKVLVEKIQTHINKLEFKPILKPLVISYQGTQQTVKEKFKKQKMSAKGKEDNKNDQIIKNQDKNTLNQVYFSLMQKFLVKKQEVAKSIQWREKLDKIDQLFEQYNEKRS